jgi:hypothetical protein
VDVHSSVGQHCDEMFDLKPIDVSSEKFGYTIGASFELLGGCPLARSNELTQADHQIGANSQVLRCFWWKTQFFKDVLGGGVVGHGKAQLGEFWLFYWLEAMISL